MPEQQTQISQDQSPTAPFLGEARKSGATLDDGVLAIPPRPNISMVLELLTPALASALLPKMHPQQRRTELRHVTRIASDMMNGRYIFTGDTIVIDWDGYVINGQHRINAVVQSGIPQWMIFVYGVDPKALAAIDNNNKPRTVGDVVRILGGSADPAVIDAIAFSAAGGIRASVLAMSNAERVELTRDVSEELIKNTQRLAQCATAGKIKSRSLLSAAFTMLNDSDSDQQAVFSFLEATFKNDAMHPSYSATSNLLYNFLLKLKAKKKEKTPQDYDNRVQHAILRGCTCHQLGRVATSVNTFVLRATNDKKEE